MIPFLDLAAHHSVHRDRFHELLDEILTTSSFVGGNYVERFEHDWAEACGTAHAVGVANGTDALELVLQAMGIGRGDEVIVPTNTFVATAAAVVRVGAQPVFCDVEPDTLLMSGRTVEAALGPNVTAVIAVHLFGQPVNMPEIRSLADRHGLAVIEDAAQAHLAAWDDQPVGSLGDAATFSFYPGKNLGALGDGGAVTTNDSEIARNVRQLSNHGRPADIPNTHVVAGRNSRLDGLQAAFLCEKLQLLEHANSNRRRHHDLYRRLLPPATPQVTVDERAKAVHHLEVIRSPDRDRLVDHLRQSGIGVGIHYSAPCHQLGPFRDYRRTDTSVADGASVEILSLPIFPEMTEEQTSAVCSSVSEFVGSDTVHQSPTHVGQVETVGP